MALISKPQIEQFREEGYFVTHPMWTDRELRAVSDEFDRLYAVSLRGHEESKDETKKRLTRLRPFIGQAHTKSVVLCEFIKSPFYLEACAKLIGPDADLYYNQVVIKPPEEGLHFGWHQDSGYTVTEPLEYMTCWTAISRTDVENGCIWIIPGSHKRGLIEHCWNERDRSTDAVLDNEEGAIPVEMQRGQVAVFSSLMLHRSGPNVSSETRKGYVPQYHVPNVRQKKTGKPFGDAYPVLRDGRRVDVPGTEPAAAENGSAGDC